jgi:hypothetical protein
MTNQVILLTCTIFRIAPPMNDKSSRPDQSLESVDNSIVLSSQNPNCQNQTSSRKMRNSTQGISDSNCIRKNPLEVNKTVRVSLGYSYDNPPKIVANKRLNESSKTVRRAAKCDDECRNTPVRSIHHESVDTSQNDVESPRNKD